VSRFLVGATWDDAPHLTDQAKAALWSSIPPYQRDARSKGIPQLGAGAIYQVPESDVKIPPFQIPKHWRFGYGKDVGWNRTAHAYFAQDPDTGRAYIYNVHYRAEAEPSTHAAAAHARERALSSEAPKGWLPGKIDPASRGRSQVDGRKLLESYIALGLNLETATNAVETGIYAVWMALSEGRLKVFATCVEWFAEYRLYRRNERGQVIKKFDHLMDATRYGLVDGLGWLKQIPAQPKQVDSVQYDEGSLGLGWLG
jgi:hypothetical protein